MNNDDLYFSEACFNYGDDIYLLDESRTDAAQTFFPLVEGREIMTDKIVFLLCRDGSIDIKLNYHKLCVTTGTALIALPGMIIETLAVSNDARVLAMLLSKAFANSLNLNRSYRTLLSIQRKPLVTMMQGMDSALINLYEMVRGMLQQPSHPHIDKVLHLLFEAYFYGIDPYLHSTETKRITTAAEDHTEEFLRLVEQHFRTRDTVDWYAEQLGLSSKRLSICVKKTSGQTATYWIDRHRLIEACHLLCGKHLIVKEVASSLGFPNQSAFGTWFKRLTGQSPKMYAARTNDK